MLVLKPFFFVRIKFVGEERQTVSDRILCKKQLRRGMPPTGRYRSSKHEAKSELDAPHMRTNLIRIFFVVFFVCILTKCDSELLTDAIRKRFKQTKFP